MLGGGVFSGEGRRRCLAAEQASEHHQGLREDLFRRFGQPCWCHAHVLNVGAGGGQFFGGGGSFAHSQNCRHDLARRSRRPGPAHKLSVLEGYKLLILLIKMRCRDGCAARWRYGHNGHLRDSATSVHRPSVLVYIAVNHDIDPTFWSWLARRRGRADHHRGCSVGPGPS